MTEIDKIPSLSSYPFPQNFITKGEEGLIKIYDSYHINLDMNLLVFLKNSRKLYWYQLNRSDLLHRHKHAPPK